MQNAKPCSFCGDGTHLEWHCPELVAPIRDQGMMKPPAGTPMSGGDDDSLRCPKKLEPLIARDNSARRFNQDT